MPWTAEQRRKKRGITSREITCVICSKVVKTFYPRQTKTCGSVECTKKYHKLYKKTPKHRADKRKSYYKCRKKALDKAKQKYKEKRGRLFGIIQKTCKICKKKFEIENTGQRTAFCSEECRKENEKIKTEKQNKRRRKPLLNKICVSCKEEFITNKSIKKNCGKKECKNKQAREKNILWEKNNPEKRKKQKSRNKEYLREYRKTYKKPLSYCECGNVKQPASKKCMDCTIFPSEYHLSIKEMEFILKKTWHLDKGLNAYYRVEYKRKKYSVHRLVYCVGHKKYIKKGMVINHKNHIKTDNRLKNLEEITPKQNAQKAIEFYKKHPQRSFFT